jgi:hypothetical protein
MAREPDLDQGVPNPEAGIGTIIGAVPIISGAEP